MKNCILMMCIVAYASIFSSCSNDDSPTASANLMQIQNSTAKVRPEVPEKGTISTGTITGSFYPLLPLTTVIAIPDNSKEIKYAGYIWGSGLFKIAPLPVGSYTVLITPKDSPAEAVIVREIEVDADQTTDVGSIFLNVDH